MQTDQFLLADYFADPYDTDGEACRGYFQNVQQPSLCAAGLAMDVSLQTTGRDGRLLVLLWGSRRHLAALRDLYHCLPDFGTFWPNDWMR